jgi:hypothetical protein
MRSARICAEPSTKRVVASRCLISTSTFTRLTNEKPQSTLHHRGEPPDVADGDGIVEAELLPEVRPDLRRDVGVRGELPERVAGARARIVNSTRLMPMSTGSAVRRRRRR